jgi:hypothetical protein
LPAHPLPGNHIGSVVPKRVYLSVIFYDFPVSKRPCEKHGWNCAQDDNCVHQHVAMGQIFECITELQNATGFPCEMRANNGMGSGRGPRGFMPTL